ncbi:MAG: alpha/beta hydrolase [Bacteroidales bacterium]|nr:alpha/beta hydrolase [Bacteroidales bacterium]
MKKLLLLFTIVLSIFFVSCNENKDGNDKKTDEISFYETELIITPDSVDLFGTLLMPDSLGEFPLVIIVAGSGPTDRNGNNPLGVTAKPYELLADTLVKSGVATFRYDKRGIAKSVAKGLKEEDLSFDTYVNDLIFIVNELKKDKRFNKIIILGHSEGALIGAIASNEINADKFISVSGVSRPADLILIEQLVNGLNVDKTRIKSIIEQIKEGKIAVVEEPELQSIFRPSVQPYLASWFKYNPVDVYAQLTMPVLIIHGTTDIQVPPQDAESLAFACPKSTLSIIEGMNHVLKTAPADTIENSKTYSNSKLPLKEKLVEDIIDFVLK